MKHEKLWKRLIEAVKKPKEVAVIKLAGHTRGNTKECMGNAAADEAAKLASGQIAKIQEVMLRSGKATDAQHIAIKENICGAHI